MLIKSYLFWPIRSYLFHHLRPGLAVSAMVQPTASYIIKARFFGATSLRHTTAFGKCCEHGA